MGPHETIFWKTVIGYQINTRRLIVFPHGVHFLNWCVIETLSLLTKNQLPFFIAESKFCQFNVFHSQVMKLKIERSSAQLLQIDNNFLTSILEVSQNFSLPLIICCFFYLFTGDKQVITKLNNHVLSNGLPKPEYVCVKDGPEIKCIVTCKIGEDLSASGIFFKNLFLKEVRILPCRAPENRAFIIFQ